MHAACRSPERYTIVILLAVLCWTALRSKPEIVSHDFGEDEALEARQAEALNRTNVLRTSRPAPSFRGNLRPDLAYVTGFAANGFSAPYPAVTSTRGLTSYLTANQVVTAMKLAHIARLLDRTVVLCARSAYATQAMATHDLTTRPDFVPVHEEGTEELMSRFFDLERFALDAGLNVTEWRRLKTRNAKRRKSDSLSCWGHWRLNTTIKVCLSSTLLRSPFADQYEQPYGLHVTFWQPPVEYLIDHPPDLLWSFPGIQALASTTQKTWLDNVAEGRFPGKKSRPARPDQHMLCFDNLFPTCPTRFAGGAFNHSFVHEEIDADDPVWLQNGVHLRFTAEVDDVADDLLSHLLGSSDMPYIAVHIRQGDFVELGRVKKDMQQLFDAAVIEIREALGSSVDSDPRADVSVVRQARIARRHGGHDAHAHHATTRRRPQQIPASALPVLFATDSTDAALIESYRNLGWIHVDHEAFDTVKRFGRWWPSVLDSVILSRATGFAGTKLSTFSSVAARRVESWNGGVTKLV